MITVPTPTIKPKLDLEDLIVWSDCYFHPTWCYAYELEEMNHMSDDYRRIPFDSKDYDDFMEFNR